MINKRLVKKKQAVTKSSMTANNLSKAANTVGQWVLTGLGKAGQAFNDLLTSGAFTDFGQTSPFVMSSVKERRTIQKGKLKAYKKANEKIMLGMTWTSPLNYGAALVTGNGLNARKGEEEVASWSPAWQATARLIELGVGPKAVKGVKATPRVVVNTAAKAGVKPARAAVIARKIKLATKDTKLNSNNTAIPHEDLFDFWHGGLEPDFDFGNLDVFRKASKQSKRNRNYAGFYMYNTPRLLGAFNYGFGEAHGIKLKPDAKKLKVNFNTERIEALELLNYRNQGYDYIEGKDVWGAPEYILLNKDAIQHTGFFDQSLGHNIYILRDRNIPKIDLSMNNLPSKTSLKFFERKPASISEAERAGATKWDRNFKRKWHVANYPGYLLKGLMKGSRLEKQLSKKGTININLLNAYFNKASQIEKDVTNKILAEKFAGLKTINYNLFKKAVLDELIGNYNRNYNALSRIPTVTTEELLTYGGDRLGIIKDFKKIYDGAGGVVGTWKLELPVSFKQFTFETPKISIGNRKHYSGQPIGHTRTFTNQQEPLILHVMESQSDWGLAKLGNNPALYTGTSKYLNDPVAYRKFIDRHKRLLSKMLENPSDYLAGAIERQIANIEHHEAILKLMLEEQSPLVKYLHDNYLQRLLQENLRYAAENGLSKMRYPTSETAAKIERYHKVALPRPTRHREVELMYLLDKMWKEYYDANESQLNNTSLLELDLIGRKNIPNYAKLMDELEQLKSIPDKYDYIPAHKTILKKYADFPKLFLKLYKGLDVSTVTDTKGNTWYEVNVPKGYLNSEWLFNRGAAKPFTTADDGSLIDLTKRTNFTNPDTRYKRGDVLIEDEYGTDLYSYPEYIKYRISKLKQIVPDKIKDYTVPKLDPGEINLKKEQLISRDNFIRNNIGFNPMATMSMGKNLKTHLWEINRRLSKLYPDLPKYVTEGINNAENKPFIIGYFNEPNILGLHSLMRGINLVEPSPKSNLPRTMLHEGVMHGTEPYMTNKIANAYLLFINKIYESPYIENGIYTKNNWSYKAPEGTERWEEGRATFGEIRKFLYDKISKDNNILFSTENMDKLIPIFEKTVDKLNTNDIADLLNKTNGYGEVYGTIGPKANSNFLKDSKDLLKYMPATLPFLIPKKEKKK